MYKKIEPLFNSCFFIAIAILGIYVYRDYGISLDEPAQRIIGIANLNYIFEFFGKTSPLINHYLNIPSLIDLEDRHYGVIFEVPAAFLELFFDFTIFAIILLVKIFL